MKGIILAGGSGTRLYPITHSISKQIIPVYDKPMIYYPLSVLMLAGIRDILIISTPRDIPLFQDLLGNGERIGLKLQYAEQAQPEGLAQAFLIGKDFIQGQSVCMILGDNIFFGHGLAQILRKAAGNQNEATVFGYNVTDPERYGVVEFNENGQVLSIEEKPLRPRSGYAVTGLYFYPGDVAEKAAGLKPSPRGELEITDLNNLYLKEKRLNVKILGRGIAWLDTGTHESLLQASIFISTLEKRQGLKASCIEEIAFNSGFIDRNRLEQLGMEMGKSQYGEYLLRIAREKPLPENLT